MSFKVEVPISNKLIQQMVKRAGLSVHNQQAFDNLVQNRAFQAAIAKDVLATYAITIGDDDGTCYDLLASFGPIADNENDRLECALRYK